MNCGAQFAPDAIYVRDPWDHHPGPGGDPAEPAALVVEVNGPPRARGERGSPGHRARTSHRFTPLARAARVVTVSPLLKEALASRYGFPPDHIDVVPNGVDTDLFRPADRDEARKRLGLPLDRRIVVCVAGFFSHHALDLLIAAASRTNAQLILVGKEGPSGGDIVHAGRVSHQEVPHYLAAADICAYVLRTPHAQFGFSPLKVYEYMAAGRPVVAATHLPKSASSSTTAGSASRPTFGSTFAAEMSRLRTIRIEAGSWGGRGARWRRLIRVEPGGRPGGGIPSPRPSGMTPQVYLCRHPSPDADNDPMIPEQAVRVSVVLPTVDRPDAIYNLLKHLEHQSTAPFEIVVVDQSAVPDGRLAAYAAANPRIRVHRIAERGLPNARNVGVGLSRGDVVLFLDDDTIPDSDLVRCHASNYKPAIAGVGGRVVEARPAGAQVGRFHAPARKGHPELPGDLGPGHPPGGKYSFRREVFDRVGGFDPAYGGSAITAMTPVFARGDFTVFDPRLPGTSAPADGDAGRPAEDWLFWHAHNTMLFVLRHARAASWPLFLVQRVLRIGWFALEHGSPALMAIGLRGLLRGVATHAQRP